MPPGREQCFLSACDSPACCCLVGPMACSHIITLLVISVAPVPASDNRCRTIACRNTSNVAFAAIVCCHCGNTSHVLCAHDFVDHTRIAKTIQPCTYVYSVLAIFAQPHLHDADFARTCSVLQCLLCLVSAYITHDLNLSAPNATSSIMPYI